MNPADFFFTTASLLIQPHFDASLEENGPTDFSQWPL